MRGKKNPNPTPKNKMKEKCRRIIHNMQRWEHCGQSARQGHKSPFCLKFTLTSDEQNHTQRGSVPTFICQESVCNSLVNRSLDLSAPGRQQIFLSSLFFSQAFKFWSNFLRSASLSPSSEATWGGDVHTLTLGNKFYVKRIYGEKSFNGQR